MRRLAVGVRAFSALAGRSLRTVRAPKPRQARPFEGGPGVPSGYARPSGPCVHRERPLPDGPVVVVRFSGRTVCSPAPALDLFPRRRAFAYRPAMTTKTAKKTKGNSPAKPSPAKAARTYDIASLSAQLGAADQAFAGRAFRRVREADLVSEGTR